MISFVNPRSTFLEKDGMMPPLGLFYLVSVLKKAGIKSQIIDLSLGDMLPDDHVLLTATTPQIEEAIKAKRAYSVIGGPHASIVGKDLLSNFDLVVCGEGEEVIKHIVTEMPRGILKTRRIKNLDSIPFPDRETAYRYEWKINGKPATTLVTSRGCNGRCSFCCKAVMNRGIYLRSVQNIIDELVIIKHYGFEAVMFYDDSIAIDRGRLEELCEKIRRLNLTWRCFVRSDQVDLELFTMMADAGCYEVLIGIESGSDKILKNIRKQETKRQHRNAIFWAKHVGIRVKSLMIVGLPGESWETVEESRQFILETQPDELDVTILSVYKGCDIYKNPDKYELTFSEPTFYKGKKDESICGVSTPYMSSKEIIQAQKILYQAFKGN